MAQISTDKIHLAAMELPEFNVVGGSTPSQAAFTIRQRVNVEHDPDLTFILISLRIACSQVGDDGSTQGASGIFYFRFFFTVDNLRELMVEAAGKSIPQPQLAATLTSIAYSTARGILWARLAGTPLEGFALPIIDPMRLLLESSQEIAAEEKTTQE